MNVIQQKNKKQTIHSYMHRAAGFPYSIIVHLRSRQPIIAKLICGFRAV